MAVHSFVQYERLFIARRMDVAKGARGCREHVLDPNRRRRGPQAVECVIAIVDQISKRLVPRKRLAQLLGRPAAVGAQ
jgi:hypothetical protein